MGAIAVLFAVTGLFITTVGRRAAKGELKRNFWMGIRTKASRASDEAWVVAHQAGMPKTILAGRIFFFSGFIAAALGLAIGAGNPNRTMLVWGIAVAVLPFVGIVPAIQATLAGDRAAKEWSDQSSQS